MNKARQICKTMLFLRGYTLQSSEDTESFIFKKKCVPLIYVYFINHPKLNMGIVKQYYSLIHMHQIKHCILIYQDTITTSVKKTLLTMYNVRIELFSMHELQFNITSHYLVPKHTKITTEDHKEYTKYPILKKSDPQARFYGFNSGDLIRIDRKDGTVSFRIVK